jgi:hypothetical protein
VVIVANLRKTRQKLMTLYQSEVQMAEKNVISRIEDILVIGVIQNICALKVEPFSVSGFGG